MKFSRGRILADVRRALGKSGSGPARGRGGAAGCPGRGADWPAAEVSRQYRIRGRRSREEVMDLLVQRLEDYHAGVIRESPQGLASAVASLLSRRGAGRMVVPEDLPEAWLSGVPLSAVEFLRDPVTGPPLSKGRLASVRGVVTGCALAVAETGTIILDSGPAQGRRALTLLPDYHLCVVQARQVVELVPQAVARLQLAVAEAGRPITLVSGPSATSDIELERVEGVHGPRTLDVILVEDDS